jgi:hypothetical protein
LFPWLLALLAACATIPPVDIQYDAAKNFTKYRSYSWINQTVPKEAYAPMYERLKASFDRSLLARGFSAADPGQFSIAIGLYARERVQHAGSGAFGGDYSYSDWGPSRSWSAVDEDLSNKEVRQAALIMIIRDTATNERIWEGIVRKEIIPGDLTQAQLDRIVDAIVAQFPPDIRCTQIAARYQPCSY